MMAANWIPTCHNRLHVGSQHRPALKRHDLVANVRRNGRPTKAAKELEKINIRFAGGSLPDAMTATSLKPPLRLLHKHFFHDQGGSPAHELWIGNPKHRHK